MAEQQPAPLSDLIEYYTRVPETTRLTGRSTGELEFVRTQELILRRLPPPPAAVLDVGGGTGVYSLWLAALGYSVQLIDPVPLHVELARQASAALPGNPFVGAAVGDARALVQPDTSIDAVLLLGPLYHLTDRPDRLLALREALRVLRRGGVVFATAVSRFAPLLDGFRLQLFDDTEYFAIVDQGLRDGQHRTPRTATTGRPRICIIRMTCVRRSRSRAS
ncbi:MAG: class I SAM-dependent methyltransferase [Dehalococcoidia bacterium]